MLSSIVKNLFQVKTVVPATVCSTASSVAVVKNTAQVIHPAELARLLAARDAAEVSGQGKHTIVEAAITGCGRDCKDCIIKISKSAQLKKEAAEADKADESRRRGLDLEHGADVLVFGFAVDLDKVPASTRDVFVPAGQKFVAGPNSITTVRPTAPVTIKAPAPVAAHKSTPPPSLSSSISSVSSFGSGSGPVTPPTAAHHRATRPRPMYLRSASSNISSSSSSSASSNFSLPTSLLASPASAFSLGDGERIVVRGQKVGKGWF